MPTPLPILPQASRWTVAGIAIVLCAAYAAPASSQQRPANRPAQAPAAAPAIEQASSDPRLAPTRREGEGPFQKLIIRGATLIDGTGAPPRGPVDIVIENNMITQVAGVGYPGVPIDSAQRPRGPAREINAEGMYVMPGLVDLHVHQGTRQKAPDSEYYNKLWLGHGITTVRGVRLRQLRLFGEREGAEREERDHGAAVRRVPAARQRLGPGTGFARPSRRARGCAGPRPTAWTA